MAIVTVKLYIQHLRLNHSQHYKSLHFTCSYGDCKRKFNIVNSFRQHLKQHFENELSFDNNINASNATTIVTDNENNEMFEPSQLMINTSSPNNFKFDFLKLTLNLLGDESLPRKKSLSILKKAYDYFKNVIFHIKSQIQETVPKESFDEIFTILDKICSADVIKSEYIIFKELERLGYFIQAQKHLIHSTTYVSYKNNIEVIRTANDYIEFIPLNKIFTTLLNLPGFIDDILIYIHNINMRDDVICNIVQSKMWREKLKSMDNIDGSLILPLLLFNDDFEPLDSLGVHAGAYKIGGVYIKIGCLPENLQSKIDFIFLAMLYFSGDRRDRGNKIIFSKLIDELNILYCEGVAVNHSMYKTVKFITVLVLGDNLGVNGILGFTECFVAHYWCRFCRCNKNVMQYQTVEDSYNLRNEDNYKIDIITADVMKTGK